MITGSVDSSESWLSRSFRTSCKPVTRGISGELLAEPDETVRAVAARALARVGTQEAAESLTKTLNDPSELTRLRMAENLDRIGPLAVKPLLDTLENGEPQARVFAARVLGNLRAAEARPVLRHAMLDGSLTDLRAQATLALGKIGDPDDVHALLAATDDERWPVRAQVANTLGMIGDVWTIPTLQRMMTDHEWWVRLNASRALANMGPAGERALVEVLEDPDLFARQRAAATLEAEGVTRRLVRQLDAPDTKGERARRTLRAVITAGATKQLRRLARTMPDGGIAGSCRRCWRRPVSLNDLILGVNYAVLAYFLLLNGVYVVLYAISFAEISDYARREVFGGLSELFASDYAPPVTVVVPAYNEEATIAESVRSFLALHYPLHEVIVVNDGSRDATLEVLVREFDLHESDQPVRKQLKTAEIFAIHTSPSERLVVVDKANGGKADALNAGICAARYPFVCCIDADIILEEDALLRVARPMVESSEVAAVGGIIRVANGCEVDKGRVVEVRTPRNAIPTFQVVEYLRAFLAARTGWSALNCLLIISGAFGMFRRRDLIASGGYAHDTVGEDMELVTRMHRTLREAGRNYKVTFVPDPVAWTEVPATLRVLRRQRDRWHRGLIETLLRHRRMLFNPRYGTVGLLAAPFYFLFELIGPVVELLGYVAFVAGLLLGILNLEFALAFFLAAVGLGALLSIAAVFLEELRLRRYPRWSDLLKLTTYGILENLGYRQINTIWRVLAIASFLRKNTDWGAMERRGFDPVKTIKKG